MGAALDLSHLPLAQQRSRPTLLAFNPDGIFYQRQVLKLVRRDFDYSTGNLEILLSGSYGSAKSVLLAHLAVTHCMMNRRARVAIVRRALPDIKATIYKEILEHIDEDLVEGTDYWINSARGSIKFRNGSEIVSVYWSDRRYKRVRSLKLSMVIIEEGSENDDRDREGFLAIKARLRRLPHIRENVLIIATNPDDPAHWLYEYFIEPNEGLPDGVTHPTRRVFYSVTEDNPYLDPIYVQQLRKDMTPREARRFLNGEWLELAKDKVYYQYSSINNFKRGKYEVDPKLSIRLSWDFNIGIGKPLSVAVFQRTAAGVFHFFHECVVEGMRTEDSLEELAARGIFDMECTEFIVNGDSSGKHKDTRNIRDDYEIIVKWLANFRNAKGEPLRFRKLVPLANPPVRERHNRCNSHFLNDLGERRLYVWEACKMLHKGFRLVELKKGGDIVEDDSKDYQHITTSAGYGICAAILYDDRKGTHTKEF